jgi:hypothetical protein
LDIPGKDCSAFAQACAMCQGYLQLVSDGGGLMADNASEYTVVLRANDL